MLKTIEHGDIVELQMNRPPANALNAELVNCVAKGHRTACDGGAGAVVLSGLPGMFSGGLDVPELIKLERDRVQAFWIALLELMKALAKSPIPVVAAMTGHSPAGGAVLAVHCDYRVAAAGDFKIGFNEVRVGLPVPRTILLALANLVGARTASLMATQGRLLSPEQAEKIGLVDELAEPDAVVSRAVEWARKTLELPPVAMNTTRLLAKQQFVEALDSADDASVATDYWFSDETQTALHSLVDSLGK